MNTKASRQEQRNKRAARARRKMECRKEKRRQPYDDETLLAQIVRPHHHVRMRTMFSKLHPYLVSGIDPRRQAYLNFDLRQLEGHRIVVYNTIAQFIYGCVDKNVLNVSVAAFTRYLTDPKHSNLQITSKTLETKLQESKKMLNLT